MIRIIKIGNISRKSLRKEVDLYLNRINRFLRININNVKSSTFKDSYKVIDDESDRLFNIINESDYSICLDKSGNKVNSEQFADKLNHILSHGKKPSFIIGGAYGLSDKIKRKSDMVLSFSDFTIQHDIILIVLLEQIYRGLTIMKGHPYHK
jgi:23S rRNA (pseudouridine1915-N3)-methyltransferase